MVSKIQWTKRRPIERVRKFQWKAFGLVEVILGMFVLTAALTVVMLPAVQSIRYEAEDRRVVLAANLAQEGVEMVRNIRDNQFAQAGNGQGRLSKAFPSGMNAHDHEYCNVDLETSVLNGSNCKTNPGNNLNTGIALVGNFYKVNGAATFRRLIDINKVSDTRYDITVYVTWGNTDITGVSPSSCTRANQCVFSQATFTDWNYWGN